AVVEVAGGVIASAQSSLTGTGENLTVFNVNSHPPREVVEVGDRPILVDAPACGWASVAESTAAEVEPISISGRVMENGLLRVTWDGDGLLTSIWDKEANREVLTSGSRGNLLQLHGDNPKNWDAWDVDADYRLRATDITGLAKAEVEMQGPLRGAVGFTREFGSSKLYQRMVLDAGSRRRPGPASLHVRADASSGRLPGGGCDRGRRGPQQSTAGRPRRRGGG